MSEELDTGQVTEQVAGQVTLEDVATEYGWSPDKGDKSAIDFIKVALDKFPEQNKTIKNLYRTVEEMKEHMAKINSRELQELEDKRRSAIQEGNIDLVDRLEKERDSLRPVEQMNTQQEIPAVKEFEERNSKWLTGASLQELKMQKYMEDMAVIIGKRKLDPDSHMKLLEEAVKSEFPSYFEEVTNPVLASVDNVAGRTTGTKKFSFRDLNDIQKQVARDFERAGVISPKGLYKTMDEFVDELVKNGELR